MATRTTANTAQQEVGRPDAFYPRHQNHHLSPRKGHLRYYNPLNVIKFINELGDANHSDTFLWTRGIANAVGMRNPGFDAWAERYGKRIRRNGLHVILSVASDPRELRKIALRSNDLGLVGIEVNVSCPNIEGGIEKDPGKIIENCRSVHRATSLPIILKLSVTQHPGIFLPELRGIVEAVAINSVPWDIAFPDIPSPLFKYGGGGVSGKAAQAHTWAFAEKIARVTKIPVIWPSVWEYEDFLELRQRNVPAISFGSIFLRYPWRPTTFIRKLDHPEREKQPDELYM